MEIPTIKTLQILEQLASGDGIFNTPWPQLIVAKATVPTQRTPMHYKPSLCFALQGQKQVYLGEQCYTYDPDHYLVVPMALPLDMAITQASANKPMLGIALELDLTMLSELIISMDAPKTSLSSHAPALFVSTIKSHLKDALKRFLSLLNSPEELKILGKERLREVMYWALQDEQGEQLRQLVTRDSNSFRIAHIIAFINENFDQPMNIDELSSMANMSGSALHQKFKQVTCMSPLQYLKKIRLHQARNMMLEGRLNASDAGYKVGYNNPSQFSREFKRMFGMPPTSLRNTLM